MSESPSIGSLKKSAILIPLGLFLAAFLLRLVGIGWGMPNSLRNQTYHPDELINYGVAQQVDLAHGKLTPGFYNYGTAYFIALSIVDKVVSAYGGGQPSIDQWGPYWRSIGGAILAGRILSALAGAGCVVVAWLILRRITTQFGALFGAALIAIAPGFLVQSRYQTPDVFFTFWLFLSALFALRILGARPDSAADLDQAPSRDWRDAILAGLFAGIGAGTKYAGVLVLIVLWVSLGMTRRPKWALHGVAGTLVCVAAFLATTPGILLDSAAFWRDFDYELWHTAKGHGLVFIGTPSGFLYHLGNLLVGVGLLATLAGVAGLIFGSWRKHAWAVALLAFLVVYYILIGRAEVKFMRYTFPLLLPLTIGYGYAMGTAFRRRGSGLGWAVAGVFALTGNPFFDFGGLIGAAKYTMYMAAPDPRDEAALYLRGLSKDETTVGLVKDPWFWTSPLIPDAGMTRAQIPLIYSELAGTRKPRVLRYLPGGALEGRLDWDERLLSELKPDYVVFSSFEVLDEERLSHMNDLDPGTQELVGHYRSFFGRLEREYDHVNAFGGLVPEIHDLMYIRPTVWIWKRKGLP